MFSWIILDVNLRATDYAFCIERVREREKDEERGREEGRKRGGGEVKGDEDGWKEEIERKKCSLR